MAGRFLLTVTINNQPVGIVIETRLDVAPRTFENFHTLCTGERGSSYKGSHFDKGVLGSFIQGGSAPNGRSINRATPNEKAYSLPHNAPGVVSMVSPVIGSNTSQFTITTAPAPQFNGKQVVFGKVVGEYRIVERIERSNSGSPSMPKPYIIIVNCGRR